MNKFSKKMTFSALTCAFLCSGILSNAQTNNGNGGNNPEGPIRIGPIYAPLPVSLVNFSGVTQNNSNNLNWQTATESNTKTFELERSNNGMSQWASIGTVAAKGNGGNKYSFSDNGFNAAVTFYRLKIVELNGNFAYSPVIKITASVAGNALVIYPNPARDIVTVGIGENYLNTTAKLINSNGRVLKNVLMSYHQNQMNVQSLSSGIYFLKFKDGVVKNIFINR